MRTIIATFALLALCATGAYAEEKRQIFGVASDQAIELLTYGSRPPSLMVTYTGIEKIPGFEDCKIQDLILKTTLVCGDEEYLVNGSHRVGDCEYRGLHRDGGLGFGYKATWEAWAKAARACGASAEELAKIENRKKNPSWAGSDTDPRF